MPRIRFIHCADLHLDAPFQGAAADQRVGAELAQATYAAFDRVVGFCIEQHCDFMVIAGDVFDRPDRSYFAEKHFRMQMERLGQQGIQVFVAHGNHDPALPGRSALTVPRNVHVFAGDRVERVEFSRDGEVLAALYGRSFAKAAETDNLALGFRRQTDDPIAIGVLHANVGGHVEYDPYAPASLDDLRASGMDYWALGHIHKQEVLSAEPGIVYPGSPQGLNPKETGPHGCFLVEMDGSRVELTHFEAATVGWHRSAIDVSDAMSVDYVREALDAACDAVRASQGRRVVVRFELVGRSEASVQLGRPGLLDGLLDDLRAEQTAVMPWLWVDRIDDHTRTTLDVEQIRMGQDFTSELVRYADELLDQQDRAQLLVNDIEKPVATKLRGFESSLPLEQLVEQARDLALDMLFGDREGTR